jgi:hypothetical protein
VLVEDDTLDLATIDLTPPGSSAMDIVICTGPDSRDYCPLVADGYCPAGYPDVVVSNLTAGNPWAASVRGAWADAGIAVATPREGEAPLTWPAHVGAAIRFLAGPGDEDDD